MVTTSSCPAAVVALTLIEFNRTVMIGAVVSVAAAIVVEAHIEVAGRQTVQVEHLQQQEQFVFAAYMSCWATCFLLVHWQVQRSMTFD